MTFLGQESLWAAQAAECADEQGAYWAYHDYIFGHQKGENQGAFAQDNLKKFAADLKLNTQTFNACVDSAKYSAVVDQESAFAENLGVQSTPAFLVNGQPVMGAQSFAAFQQLIDAAAKP
jgi:protein-disulfide isomerase